MNNEDIKIGQEIAVEHPCLSLFDFVRKLELLIDWDRFDYEEGMFELMQAAIGAYAAYVQSGGVVDFPLVEDDEDE